MANLKGYYWKITSSDCSRCHFANLAINMTSSSPREFEETSSSDIHASYLDSIDMLSMPKNRTAKFMQTDTSHCTSTSTKLVAVDSDNGLGFKEIATMRTRRLIKFTYRLEEIHYASRTRIEKLEAEVNWLRNSETELATLKIYLFKSDS